MKLNIYFTVLTVVLQLNNLYDFTEAKLDRECIVKGTEIDSLREDTPLRYTFFITLEDQISVHVYFEGKKQWAYNDLLILNPHNGTLIRERGEDTTTVNIILNNSIPLGWNRISISISDETMYIGHFYNITDLDYTVEEISFAAKYMTNCAKGTPKWTTKDSVPVDIPISGLSMFSIDLVSEGSFQPVLTLNTIDIPLSYDGEVIVKRSSGLLPPQKHTILLEFTESMVSISSVLTNSDPNLLIKFAIREELASLKICSVKGSFDIVLNPFPDVDLREEARRPTQYPEVQHTQVPTDTPRSRCQEYQESAPVSVKWKVATGLVLAIAVLSVIANFYLTRGNIIHFLKGKFRKNSNQELGVEEGEHLLMNQNEISAKDKIKAERTETHGEFIQEFEYQKEIYLLKLETDKKCKYKRALGELNETKQTKIILAVGETGSGKSSVLNSIANSIYGVNYEDPFRFKLIDNIDKPGISGINTTEEITSYYIPYTPGIVNASNYILIDTPGFGDLRGVDEDTKLVTKFNEFLQKNPSINEVDAICLVIKASDTRLTDIQRYIINGLLSLFGKDVMRNIFVFISFFDGTVTHVPKLLEDSGLECASVFNFDSNGLYNDSKGIEHNQHLSDQDIKEDFKEKWDMTMTGMNKFFEILKKKSSVSLILTNIVLEENKDFSKIFDEILHLIEEENFNSDEEKEKIRAKIEENQNLLLIKLEEAKKLTGRLKTIPCKENPLAINDYIDVLIMREKDGNKKEQLETLKKRNTAFYDLLKKKESKSFNFRNFFSGAKYEKMD